MPKRKIWQCLRKRPILELRIWHTKEILSIDTPIILLLNTKLELSIRFTPVRGLAAIHRRMDLNAYVEQLASEEVDLIRGKNTPKGRTAPKPLESLCGDEGETADKDS